MGDSITVTTTNQSIKDANASNQPAGRIGFVSLGCPKALVDSERILTQLRTDGYDVVPNYDDADLVVVNTCGFIDSAKAESLEAIGEALNENGKVIVTGCMGVEESAIRDEHPNVLAVTGPQQYEQVVNAVHEHVPLERDYNPHLDLVPPQGVKLTPRHYAYLKISEGCNHGCKFCIIPSMRGKLVSRPIGEVMDEAKRLVDAGVKELLVISQDTSAYGVDVKYKTDFWQGRPLKTSMTSLVEALGTLGVWVRLHYVYPYPHVDDVIPFMASSGDQHVASQANSQATAHLTDRNVLPYLDIPLQHGSPTVLKRMKRPASADNALQRIRKWREICPDITIRSTFIVGFPGETDEEFDELLDFLEAAQLDRVGCFQYSPVEGAAANDLPDHVPEEVKQARWERFMETQQAISEKKLAQKVGTVQRAIVDGVTPEGIVARGMADAPEIDGNIFAEAVHDVQVGDWVNIEVTAASEYDLFGHIV